MDRVSPCLRAGVAVHQWHCQSTYAVVAASTPSRLRLCMLSFDSWDNETYQHTHNTHNTHTPLLWRSGGPGLFKLPSRTRMTRTPAVLPVVRFKPFCCGFSLFVTDVCVQVLSTHVCALPKQRFNG